MYKKEHYQNIMNLIKREPMSQREIHDLLGKQISIQGIATDVDRGIRIGSLIYLGNKVSKNDARLLLREYFKKKSWPYNACQCYVYIPKTEKFYKRLKRKLKDKSIIQGIIELYRVIELSAMFQRIYYENPNVLKRQFKSEGQNLTDREIKQKIAKKKKETKEFYNKRDKNSPYLKIFKFDHLMYWCAFHRPVPEGHPEYDSTKDLVLIKDRLIEKLRGFITQKNSP